jgi:imidazolonepropionase-like amidohydrolase
MKRLPLAPLLPLLGTTALALCLGFVVIADESGKPESAPAAAGAAVAAAVAVDRGQAFVGAHVIPITGDPIDNGVLLVKDGKIVAVGTADDVAVPADFEKIDAAGKVIMPGLICTHSHVGQVSGGDSSSPIQPEVRVIDSINVRDSSFERARAG